jgi:hypothetical protein
MIGDDQCETVDGMRTGRGTEVFGENLPQYHFVHKKKKKHMT